MCGIIGAIAQRHVANILLEGLNRLEYRGYDSAGIAILHPKTKKIQRVRVTGKVKALAEKLKKAFTGLYGHCSYSLGNSWKTNRKKCTSPLFRE